MLPNRKGFQRSPAPWRARGAAARPRGGAGEKDVRDERDPRPRPRPARYLPGAIQNLSTGKLTTTASSVFTTDAMVPESVASIPSVAWQKLIT